MWNPKKNFISFSFYNWLSQNLIIYNEKVTFIVSGYFLKIQENVERLVDQLSKDRIVERRFPTNILNSSRTRTAETGIRLIPSHRCRKNHQVVAQSPTGSEPEPFWRHSGQTDLVWRHHWNLKDFISDDRRKTMQMWNIILLFVTSKIII